MSTATQTHSGYGLEKCRTSHPRKTPPRHHKKRSFKIRNSQGVFKMPRTCSSTLRRCITQASSHSSLNRPLNRPFPITTAASSPSRPRIILTRQISRPAQTSSNRSSKTASSCPSMLNFPRLWARRSGANERKK